ncbi:aldo/keto reductase [Candidatus Poribacteria bacterium]|nr:aldo/keto reductase [Candidatus Poribacteria bacterium]MYK20099.1 aldo/keto reductase [Candidatus Poribacteria bacterium]
MATQTYLLPRRRLGRTELEVTCLGMGGAGLGRGDVTDDEAVKAVHRAIDLGINYLDTAPLYGESERRVGLALADGWREKIYLATKTGTHPEWRGDFSGPGTRRSVENSLRLLGTDYLDVCLVHDPDSMDPVVAKGGALDELQRMREEGLIKFIGLGVRQHEFHKTAIETGVVDVILTYLDYTLLSQTANEWLLPLASECDIGIINGSPIAMGLLSGIEPDVSAERMHLGTYDAEKAHRLWQWAADNDLSLLNLAIQFCFRQPRIAMSLTGSKNVTEVEQNFAAATTPVPDEVWEKLEILL